MLTQPIENSRPQHRARRRTKVAHVVVLLHAELSGRQVNAIYAGAAVTFKECVARCRLRPQIIGCHSSGQRNFYVGKFVGDCTRFGIIKEIMWTCAPLVQKARLSRHRLERHFGGRASSQRFDVSPLSRWQRRNRRLRHSKHYGRFARALRAKPCAKHAGHGATGGGASGDRCRKAQRAVALLEGGSLLAQARQDASLFRAAVKQAALICRVNKA